MDKLSSHSAINQTNSGLGWPLTTKVFNKKEAPLTAIITRAVNEASHSFSTGDLATKLDLIAGGLFRVMYENFHSLP